MSTSPEGRVYRDAYADAINHSIDSARAFLVTFEADANNPGPDWPGDAGRFDASERARAFRDVLRNRERVARIQAGSASASDRTAAAWIDLARVVKERVSVPEILAMAGYHLKRTGRSRRTGANEYHSACPVCRDGVDRLVSWDGANGRAWCRQCGWSADVIAVTMSLIPGCEHFHDALTTLAALAVPTQGEA